MAENDEAAGPALSQDQKGRIILEETYRSEVRSALERRGEGRGNRVARFLNTSLGLWLLSTIFVSVIGTAYTLAKESWDNNRIIEKERREQGRRRSEAIIRLDLEIAFRLSNLISYLHGKHRQQIGEDRSASAEQITAERIALMIQIPPAQSAAYQITTMSLYRENRDATVVSLLAELSALERERGSAANDVDQVIARLTAIPVLFERLRLAEPRANAAAIASALQAEAFLPRWRNNNFAFTDCPASEPFC